MGAIPASAGTDHYNRVNGLGLYWASPARRFVYRGRTLRPVLLQSRKGCHMPNKVLRCGDIMPGCDKVIEGKTEDEVFAKAEEHARKEHNMTIIMPSTMREIGAAIHDKT